jgi:hypothetical protein
MAENIVGVLEGMYDVSKEAAYSKSTVGFRR